MTTGERIKARRKQLSISADELAVRVGVSRSTVFRWVKGEIEKIPAVQMSILARVLQTTESYLFGWSEDPEPDAVPNDIPLYHAATPTFRIISSGLSELPPDEQDKILAVLRAMYSNNPDLFSAKRGNDDET